MATKATQAIQSHPNAVAAFITAAVTGYAIRIAEKHGVQVDDETTAALIGGLTTARLFIGRRGVIGAAKEIWARIRYGTDGKDGPAA